MLEALDLTRTVNGKTLLDHASIKISAGNQVAITGPSGSGKSVLLRALSMLDPMDHGSVQWQGADVPDADVPKFRSQVMYLHQQPSLREGTVEGVLQEPFTLGVHQTKTYSRDRVQRWLEQLGKPASFLEQSHLDLSGGESQIVALTQALQLNPNVLLLDEPTSALDADTGQKVESLLLDWVQSTNDRAFLWITHDFQQAKRISNRVTRMVDGRLEEI